MVRRFKELRAYQVAQSEVDQCLVRDVSLGGISMSDVKAASDSGPSWSENLEYFRRTKGAFGAHVLLAF